MRHSISEAAKMVGKDRRTLYRHIQNGRLSCGIAIDDNRYIDTSELIRVYGDIKVDVTPMSQPVTGEMSQGETENVTTQLLAELVSEVKKLREENSSQSEKLEAIRKRLDERPLLEDKTDNESKVRPKKNEGQRFSNSFLQALHDNQTH